MAASAFLVAHRAGNDLERLRRAERVRPRLVEADVPLFHGRLEVRHLKTLGPLPGSRRQLRALRRRFAGRPLAGISIDRRLLDRATVADLRGRAEWILSWPVATAEEARRLIQWGVDGVITERFEVALHVLTTCCARRPGGA